MRLVKVSNEWIQSSSYMMMVMLAFISYAKIIRKI